MRVNKTDENWLLVRNHVIDRAEEALDILRTPGLSIEETAAARGVVNEAVNLLEEVYGDQSVTLTLKVDMD